MHVVPERATVRTCEECSHCHFHPNGAPSAAISLFRVSEQNHHCDGLAGDERIRCGSAWLPS